MDAWHPILERFQAQRDSIYSLYRTQANLDPRYAADALKYYDEFYRMIADPKAVQRELIDPCKPEG